MATAAIPHTFVPNTPAQSGDVNSNFDTVETFLNGSVAHLDGTKVFTGIPSGPNSDPTTANQFVRKSYADKAAGGIVAHRELTAVGATFTRDEAETGLGVTFPVPTMLPNQYLVVEVDIPRTILVDLGGGYTNAGNLMEYRLHEAGGVTLAFGQALVGALGGYYPPGVPTVHMVRRWSAGTVPWAASTSVTLTVSGTINGETTPHGGARIDGSAGLRPTATVLVL